MFSCKKLLEVKNVRNLSKKISILFMITLLFIASFAIKPIEGQAATSLEVSAESAIVVDAKTGKILYQKNADQLLPPASMTKMMTEYLVLEAINNGDISWETTTQISDYPFSISADPTFSGIGLIQDQNYTVRQLYEGMSIISDNATTIALTELIAGSESEFVKMMNAKAEEMGLPEYQFVNSTGLSNADLGANYPEGTEPDADNLLSARSAALLAYHLINDYPEALDFSSMISSELDGRPLENLNWMLPWEDNNFTQFGYEGVDGLKTGYTTEAGYCFTGTAQQGDRRVITVVMKTDSKGERFLETKKLMEYGFSQFSQTELFPAGYQLDGESTLSVAKGKEEEVDLETAESVTAMVKNGEEELYHIEYQIDESLLNEEGELTAPIEKGDKIGEAVLSYSGEEEIAYLNGIGAQQKVDLVASETVEKANWFMLTMGAIGDFFGNLFGSIADFVKGLFD
ncbi:D-Ala-D-Ala carboxypeptidase A. Serine peptidase. MEROPS family S11 [Gracilibacillus ureilyticus]|uniref:serine-type D-Ala-D-Ala carboxypeptidase n=1 Tax=Gracilibacillus ureilyticus TaxID=531814 RepID=A0A1H9V151_9BACI|nr:D-Ala-D-Ala carboxypeptidase A. Serine peptidase. MEROPS family S11 [Gracilibacillus ureilyticus]